MSTFKDIEKVLMRRHKLKSTDAAAFLNDFIEIINEGLTADRQVKIKGLGTFKLQEVKERDSVNVNTGKRVTIEAHDRMTFTPDSVMKDIINKPFSQFETVVIDDDSELLKSQDVTEKEETPKLNMLPNDVDSIEKEPETKEPETKEPKIKEPEKKESKIKESEPEVQKHGSSLKKKTVGVAIGITALAFAGGFFIAKDTYSADEEKQIDTTTVVEKTKAEKTVAQEPKQIHGAWDDNYFVRNGAYVITGTDHTRTVLKGETTASIAENEFGPDMVCYIEAYNGVTSVKPGDVLKIPALKLKSELTGTSKKNTSAKKASSKKSSKRSSKKTSKKSSKKTSKKSNNKRNKRRR